MTDRLLDLTEVQDRLSVSRAKLYRLFDEGALVSVRVGGRRLVRESDLAAYIGGLAAV